jgi:hypothetical protein
LSVQTLVTNTSIHMYGNQLSLTDLNESNEILLSLVDTDNGQSKRRIIVDSTHNYELTVGRVASKDNDPAVPSTRHLVRLDRNVFDASLTKPAWVKSSVYFVVISPANSAFTPESLSLDMLRLMSFLTQGITEAPGTPIGVAVAANMLRLTTGEL